MLGGGQAAAFDRQPAGVADGVERGADRRPVDAAVADVDKLAVAAGRVAELEVLDVALGDQPAERADPLLRRRVLDVVTDVATTVLGAFAPIAPCKLPIN